jgi:uncharacterized protein (TIGR03435 family)
VVSARIAKHPFPFSALAVACAASFGVVSASAQATTTADASPAFEVASIRPADRNAAATPRSWGEATGKVTLRRIPLKYVLLRVYDLQPDQLSRPAWLDDLLFDIVANVPAGASKAQIPLMFQSMLSERFKLKFHREPYTAKVFALVVGKAGPKLKEPLPDDPDLSGAKIVSRGTDHETWRSTGPFGNFKLTVAGSPPVTHMEFTNMTMAGLAQFLSQGQVDLPVVDATELKGSYQVTVDFPADTWSPRSKSDDASDPSGASVQDSLHKLGLDLMRREMRSEKFVVDHIENTPTPN